MIRKFLLSLPVRFQAIVIVSVTVVLAFSIAIVSSLFFDEHQLVSNTDLIDSVYQVLGTIYAILLTFSLWGVWQNFCRADACVQEEAYALLDLVHTLEASNCDNQVNLRQVALNYSSLVLQEEWSALKCITSDIINDSEPSRTAAVKIINTIQKINPKSEREGILFDQILTLLARWLDARRTRLLIARGNSAKALWPLLITGAFVLFAFHGLFVAKTLGIWIALLLGLSFVVGLTFYLIFTIDCPFAGFPSIDSEPFKLAINILKGKSARDLV